MTAYYNEIDPYAAAWLRNLISAGHIAPGDVDERSIEDVRPDELRGYTQCHFFAGIGVWSHALRRAGWADDRPVWTGSCPCQPFSSASRGRGGGFGSDKDLWPVWNLLIQERRPADVLGEQISGGLGLDWLSRTSRDLEVGAYTVWAADFCASLFGFPGRQRIYFAANTDSKGQRLGALNAQVAGIPSPWGVANDAWHHLRGVGSSRDVAPAGMGRLRAYGNAIVAQAAEEFIRAYLHAESAVA